MKRAAIVLAVIVLSLPHSAHRAEAWSETGHRLVAQIAWDRLPADARAEAAALVAEIDGLDFVSASVWMDEVRHAGVSLFDRWHYVNLPLGDRSLAPEKPHADNVMWAIASARSSLGEHDASRTARALALVTLLHTVGDLHQPLHAVSRFDAEHPTGDRGGNSVPLDEPWRNLHQLWDRMGGAFWLSDRAPAPADIERWAGELRREHPPASFLRRDVLDPTVWATESHGLAASAVYPGIEAGGTPSERYLEKTQAVARQRIALAGYRLAALIEEGLRASRR